MGGRTISSGVSGRSGSPPGPPQPPCTYLDMQPRKSCSGCGGSGCCALALPRSSFTGGFSPFPWGPGGGKAMLSPGTLCLPRSPSPCQHGTGRRGAGWSSLPPGTLCLLGGAQRIPAASRSGSRVRTHPPRWGAGFGNLISPEKRVTGLALGNSDESQKGSEAPGPPGQQPGPPRTCVGLGDTGAGPRSRLRRLGLLHLRNWIFHLGLGLAGRQGEREKAVSTGVPPPQHPAERGHGTPPPETPRLCHRPPAGRRSRWRR